MPAPAEAPPRDETLPDLHSRLVPAPELLAFGISRIISQFICWGFFFGFFNCKKKKITVLLLGRLISLEGGSQRVIMEITPKSSWDGACFFPEKLLGNTMGAAESPKQDLHSWRGRKREQGREKDDLELFFHGSGNAEWYLVPYWLHGAQKILVTPQTFCNLKSLKRIN